MERYESLLLEHYTLYCHPHMFFWKNLSNDKIRQAYAEIKSLLLEIKSNLDRFEDIVLSEVQNITAYDSWITNIQLEKTFNEASRQIQETVKDYTDEAALIKVEINGETYNRSQIIWKLLKNNDPEIRQIGWDKLLDRFSQSSYRQSYSKVKKILKNERWSGQSFKDLLLNYYGCSQQHADLLKKTILDNSLIARVYLNKKRDILKLDVIHYSDILAPYSDDGLLSFEQAKRYILDTASLLGDNVYAIVYDLFNSDRIDAFPHKDKIGSSLAMPPGNHNPSMILCNFHNRIADVLILAHEIGHAIQFEMSRHLSYLFRSLPRVLVEIPSIFFELLVADQLLKTDLNKTAVLFEILDKYMQNGMKEASYYLFNDKSLNNSSQNDFDRQWSETLQELFGSAIEYNDNDMGWALVIKNFSNPYGSLRYMLSIILSLSLMDEFTSNPEETSMKLQSFFSNPNNFDLQGFIDLFFSETDIEHVMSKSSSILRKYLSRLENNNNPDTQLSY